MSPEVTAIIQKSLDMIEARLETALSPEELSREAGFSLYHYCRLFRAATGMGVMAYVTRRRLAHAVYQMGLGRDKTTVAMDCGFDSYAGFYKAFRKEFAASPTDYLRTHRAAQPARVNLEEQNMVEQQWAQNVLKHWNMDGALLEAVYHTNTGNRSENTFLVDGRYYLKASSALGSMHRQAQLQAALARHGLAAAPVPAMDGNLMVQENGWDWLLMEKMPGQPVNAAAVMAAPEGAGFIGEGLSRLHAALTELDPLLCTEENLIDTLRYWAIPKVKEAALLDESWLDDWLERFEEVYPALPKQIVHRDPNPDNLYVADGSVVGFADFDLSRILPRTFDLAYAATGLLSDTFDRLDPQAREGFFTAAGAIWRGYHAASALTREECQTLPDMVIAIELICVAAFSGSDRFAHALEMNRQMLAVVLEGETRLRQAAQWM